MMVGFLSAILRPRATKGTALDYGKNLLDGDWTDYLFRSKTGLSVTIDHALRCTTALACTQAIACGVAMLPLKLYAAQENGGRKEARDHPVFMLLDVAPNEWQTAVEFIETWVIHAVLAGNGYAFINRVRGDRVAELIPIQPGCVTPEQADDYTLSYKVALKNGTEMTIPRRNMLHLRGPSWNAYSGLDAVRYAREAIGLALATEETHARLHSNGVRSSGFMSTEANLNKEQITALKEAFQEAQAGLQNTMKFMVMTGGMKWNQLSMSGVDSQHIETRKFQIEEICRAMGVFPQMVGHSDKTATFASAEAFFLAHVVHTLSRWTRRIEKRLTVDLLTPGEIKSGLYPKFSFQALLRGDNKTRAEFYNALVQLGIMTRNEARLLEEMNPIDGLDEPLTPLNLGTQAERDAVAAEVVKSVKASLGGNFDDAAAADLQFKIGRVLSAANERRIVGARDNLNEVLATLPPPEE